MSQTFNILEELQKQQDIRDEFASSMSVFNGYMAVNVENAPPEFGYGYDENVKTHRRNKTKMEDAEKVFEHELKRVGQQLGVTGSLKDLAKQLREVLYKRFQEGKLDMDTRGVPTIRSESPAFNLLLFGDGVDNPDNEDQKKEAKRLLKLMHIAEPHESFFKPFD